MFVLYTPVCLISVLMLWYFSFHYLDFLNHYATMTDHNSKQPWDQHFMAEFRQLLHQKVIQIKLNSFSLITCLAIKTEYTVFT